MMRIVTSVFYSINSFLQPTLRRREYVYT